jgi:hypothetical protein
MGTNGQLFPLTDNTDGAAVDQVQQQLLYSIFFSFFFRTHLAPVLLYGVHSLCFYSLNFF